MCEIYWETANIKPLSSSHFLWGTTFSPKFWKNGVSEKNEYLGGLKAWGITVFLVKKDWRIKYGFDDSISYADLGLFQLPNNQLMFSFVTLWFC